MDGACVFQPVFNVHGDLSREAGIRRIDRRTNYRREAGFEEDLSADHDEDALAPRIILRSAIDPIKVAAIQPRT